MIKNGTIFVINDDKIDIHPYHVVEELGNLKEIYHAPLINCISIDDIFKIESVQFGSINIHTLEKYQHPFLWKYLLINNICRNNTIHQYTFDVSIYNLDYSKNVRHIFVFKCCIDIFLRNIIPLLNSYIAEGNNIEDIDFDWLDEVCSTITPDYADDFSMIDYMNPSRSLESLYKFWGRLKASGYHCGERSCQSNRDDIEWDEINLTIRIERFRDKYVEKVLERIFKEKWNIEFDDVERGGYTGYVYSHSYKTAETRCYSISELGKFSESKCKRIEEETIMKLHIYLIKTYSKKNLLYTLMTK